MRKLRAVLCEDNEIQRMFYMALCDEISKKHKVDIDIKVYESGNDLLFDLEDPKFHSMLDLLFLDIHMPGINGVETARAAREIGFGGVIVFITSSTDHYTDAFDVGAFHYILKGKHDGYRFEDVFLKAVRQAESLRQEVVVLSFGNELRQIEIKKIEYFEILNKVVTVYYGNETFEFISTLERIETQLSDKEFCRIHRSYLVSLFHIKSISYSNVTMLNGTVLPVGRKYYPVLKKNIDRIKTI